MHIINIFKKREYIVGFLFLFFYYIGLLIYYLFFDDKYLLMSFSVSVGCYLCFIFLESEFDSNILKTFQIRLEKRLLLILIINLASIFMSINILTKSEKYYKNIFECLFINPNDNYTLNLEKVCVLYNIKKEDTFPYQYICKFNAEEDAPTSIFRLLLQCSKYEKFINDNEVIDAFIKENKEEEIFYYCNSKHKPTNDKNCESKIILIRFLYSVYSGIYTYLLIRYIIFHTSRFRLIKANL